MAMPYLHALMRTVKEMFMRLLHAREAGWSPAAPGPAFSPSDAAARSCSCAAFIRRGASVLLAVFASVAFGQAFPDKPIRLIIPYPPGGGSDSVMRPVADEMSRGLGQPVILDYKPGAGATLGANYVAKSAPDGYTLVNLQPAHAINATLMPKLPYDTLRDFAGISLLVRAPQIIEVRAQSPIKSLQELISNAKANPGKLNYASSGTGNASHLAVELLNSAAGIKLTHVPYKGSAPAKTALLAHEVDFLCDGLSSSIPYIQAGKFRALAVTTSTRSQVLPDVPTVSEAGVSGFDVPTWFGIFAPAGTPKPILQRLNAEMVKALRSPKVKAQLEALGFDIVGSSPQEQDEVLRAEVARWAKVVRDAGIHLD
jgi:tripartite-type tricarboxylate transporter receptor subunit TctC